MFSVYRGGLVYINREGRDLTGADHWSSLNIYVNRKTKEIYVKGEPGEYNPLQLRVTGMAHTQLLSLVRAEHESTIRFKIDEEPFQKHYWKLIPQPHLTKESRRKRLLREKTMREHMRDGVYDVLNDDLYR